MPSDAELPPPPLCWPVDIREIGAKGLNGERAATSDERQALADFLGLVSAERLDVQYVLTPRSGGKARLRGHLSAKVEQACVVTHEALEATVEEDFDFEFWPAEDLAAFEPAEDAVFAADDPDPPEPLVDGRIDLGALATELLGVSLDPYPRTPGAEFKPPADDGALAEDHPFAVLSKLKTRGGAH